MIPGCLLLVLLAAGPASAEEDPDAFPGADLFTRPGTVGLVYTPLAIVATVELGFSPPSQPVLFSPEEGGIAESSNTVPELYVGLAGAAIATGLFLAEREGRWYHIEGMAQSISLTLALTSIGKNAFGRHRPHWTLETSAIEDTRRSFPSGHSSTAFSIATYGCLFLHRDGPGLWKGVSCAALMVAAGLTAYSRLGDNRHHGSDILAGATLGITASTSLFLLAETRYRDRLERYRARTSR